MGVIDEVKQRLDIVEVIGEHTKLTKSGRNFRGLCPFHSEKNPSFYVYPERQSWHCFGSCSTGGDVFAFVMKQQNIDFGEALRLLARRAGVEIPEREERQAERDERNRLHEINAAAARHFHDQLLNAVAGKKARDYLEKRGIVAETITDFQLGYSPESWEFLKKHLADNGFTEAEMLAAGILNESEKGRSYDRFRNKLMFPIFDQRGRITGFGARVLDDSLPKYINSPQTPVFDKSGSLYGLNLAATAIRQQEKAVIVEGYMDVLTAHQHGFKNVVASMGIAITEKQVNALKKLTRNLVLSLDADTAGEEAMLRCVDYENTLSAEIKIMLMPEGQDPDEVIRADPAVWQERREQAVPIVDYTFDMLLKDLDLAKPAGKATSVERLRPALNSIKDPVRRAHYVQKLAGLLKVDDRTLEAALRQRQAGTSRKAGSAQPAAGTTLRPFAAKPLEADCLTLLMRHPELREHSADLLPEYFENTENRTVFLAWRESGDLDAIKENLDPALREYVDTLGAKNLPPAAVETRYADYVQRLRITYYRNLEARRAEMLAVAAESGQGADLARLEEEGIDNSRQLKEIFTERSQRRP
jgi:DNA primase